MTENNKGRKSLIALMVIVFIILATLTTAVAFTIDYKWFSELGYTEIFLKELVTKGKVGIPIFIVLTAILFVYFKALKKIYDRKMLEFESKGVSKKYNKWILLGSAVTSGFLSVLITDTIWYSILEFLNSTSFNVKDPVFNKDMSFYVFKLPLLEQLYSVGVMILFVIALATVAFVALMFAMKGKDRVIEDIQNRRINFKDLYNQLIELASKQTGLILGAFFLLLAFNYVLKTYTLLYSPRGVAYGASFTDLNVTLLVYRISTVLAVLSAVLVVIAGFRKKVKLALAGPILLIAVSIIGNLTALGVEAFIVSPNQLAK